MILTIYKQKEPFDKSDAKIVRWLGSKKNFVVQSDFVTAKIKL
jgi:hypothetical protein